MKKFWTALLCLTLLGALGGCGGSEEPQAEAPIYEIAMVTACDAQSIADHGPVEATWEGLRAFAEEREITFKYYEATADTDEARLAQVDAAVDGGARVIVCTGTPFAQVIHTAQRKYTDVSFILVDGVPQNADGETDVADNCTAVTFDELQAGFLAGYSAVAEGYTQLGFLADGDSAVSRRYGYGFLQGCQIGAIYWGRYPAIQYRYSAAGDSEAARKQARTWYQNGVDLIFACGDGPVQGALAEAKGLEDPAVVSAEPVRGTPKALLCAVTKAYGDAAASALTAYYDGDFAGGKVQQRGLAEDGVGIDLKQAKFTWFDAGGYQSICRSVESGQIKLVGPDRVRSVEQLLEKQDLFRLYVTVA